MTMSSNPFARMNRRQFLQGTATTLGAATLGTSLAACGGSSSSSSITVQYWDWLISQAPWVDNEIKLFHQAHPDITVKKTTQAAGTYPQLFSLAVQDHKAPDVFEIALNPPLNEQVSKGWLMPLNKWADAAWQKQFPDGTFYEGNNMFNGKIYSAPLTGQAPWLQLYIHNGVFKNAGLVNSDGSIKMPQTWDDVTHAAETIVKKSNGDVAGFGFGNASYNLMSWWLDMFVRPAGSPGGGVGAVNAIDLRTGKYTFDTDRNYEDFLKLFLEWKQKNYFYSSSMSIGDEAARALFEQGKFGMTIGGVWCQGEWTTHGFTDYTLSSFIGPDPTPKAFMYTNPGGTYYAISAQTKHPDAAWAWYNWINGPAAGKRWVQMGEDLSAFAQDNDASLVKFKPFADYIRSQKNAIPGPNPSARNPQTSHVTIDALTPDLGNVLAGLYTGQITDMHGALASLSDRSQQALQKAIDQAKSQGYKVSMDDYTYPDWDITKPYVTKPQ